MVTHGLHWLPYTDKVFVVNDGYITETGSYEQLLKKNGMFSEFVKKYLMEQATVKGNVPSSN